MPSTNWPGCILGSRPESRGAIIIFRHPGFISSYEVTRSGSASRARARRAVPTNCRIGRQTSRESLADCSEPLVHATPRRAYSADVDLIPRVLLESEALVHRKAHRGGLQDADAIAERPGLLERRHGNRRTNPAAAGLGEGRDEVDPRDARMIMDHRRGHGLAVEHRQVPTRWKAPIEAEALLEIDHLGMEALRHFEAREPDAVPRLEHRSVADAGDREAFGQRRGRPCPPAGCAPRRASQ